MRTFLLAFICFHLSFAFSIGQGIVLKITPDRKVGQERSYIFNQVIDSRGQNAVGQLYDSFRNKRTVSFEGEISKQSLAFFNSKVISSSSPLYKIDVKIYTLNFDETYQTAMRGYKGEIKMKLGFFLNGMKEPMHLVDFNSTVQYGRPANEVDFLETSIQRLFENSWEYFDSWLTTQYQSNRSLASTVGLNIIDPLRLSGTDTVFYDPERPLTWMDFKDRPNPRSSYNATIFSSLSIEGNASIQNGEIVQTIEVKVYMLPGQSWVKDANEYANNHEQRHFDLTRIAADRMIYRLKNLVLEPDLFEAKLNDVYLDAYREMNVLQDLYDSQTRNGINKEAQSRWNQFINEGLAGNWENLDTLIDKSKSLLN